MPISANGTKLANLVNPQVMADMISAELPNAIAFYPLAVVDRDLEGRPGNTISFPAYAYIGDATTVAEGADIPISTLTASTTSVTVIKAGKGVELSDEAVLSGYGDPVGEAKEQLKMAIANKVDNDLMGVLATGTLTGTTDMSVGSLLAAKAAFGEKTNQPALLVVNAKNYAKIATSVLNLENTDKVLVDGVVGKVGGLQVFISEKANDTTGYIIAQGALGLALKRDVMVETDRDIIAGLTVLTANEHYAAYLKDASKAIKLTIPAA